MSNLLDPQDPFVLAVRFGNALGEKHRRRAEELRRAAEERRQQGQLPWQPPSPEPDSSKASPEKKK